MNLKKVTLNNYRCFEHLEIDLHPRLTVLVGENGAGKTAVLDGIATGLSPILNYLSSANQRLSGRGIQDNDFRVMPVKSRSGRLQSVVADYSQIIMEADHGLIWDQLRESIDGVYSGVRVDDQNLKKYLFSVVDSFDKENTLFIPVVSHYGVERGYVKNNISRGDDQDYEYPTSALVGALGANCNFDEMLGWFEIEEYNELRLHRDQGADYSSSPILDAIRDAITVLLDGKYTNPHFNARREFSLDQTNGGAPLLISQLSQGYKNMLGLAMDFAHRLAIVTQSLWSMSLEELCAEADKVNAVKNGTHWELNPNLVLPSIMLIDEIDLHLHPTWQQRVLGDLMRTFPLTQFIVTTHSPQVLSTVPRECIRILRQTETGYEAVLPDFSPLAHESGEALARVMGTHNPPSSPLLDKVHEFEQLVLAGQESSERAQALHQELDRAGYQFMDSDLHTWRVLAKHRASKLKA